ncbi:uncharacterized protein LOC103950768 [Pyrus x bretschneideri]|uniref:uncharacterized protein LOC103950768 n=1 Tax=Pyrus x bretschneideri TaxID=225117 RepID=UPI002030F6D8|nr:uncharacterized protein LOC103950768 [Pyrus x bretschneideri]XP_009360278.2 uncharacterized protein LOC103950768 [Pyrus x bretschneideri]
MAGCSQGWVFLLAVLVLALSTPCSQAYLKHKKFKTKTDVYLSPKFVLEPGLSSNKYFYNIQFPKGHIGIKSFNAEVVDAEGRSTPLNETYLHHWVVLRYYARKSYVEPKQQSPFQLSESDVIWVENSGVCQSGSLGQYYGLGSETRKTATHVPGRYAIEVGDGKGLPDGFEERWMVNVHAIDTRGVEDNLGCTECRCDLYNVSRDPSGQPLPAGYTGGLLCCTDGAKCRLKQGFDGEKINHYLRYTVKWVDWSEFLLPAKIYIFDATDIMNSSAPAASKHNCQVEYDVAKSCNATGVCLDNKWAKITMPTGGYVIYGVAHQHKGALGSTLYGQDGRVLCSSTPMYGNGTKAGNEAGYIVGMTTCYPWPGSVKIKNAESLTLVSSYNSTQMHSGVMGLFYILVAETL